MNASLRFARRALVLVYGMTPPIVTETIFSLLKPSPTFSPTEIHIVTTLEGERSAREKLLHPEHGSLWRMRTEYGFDLPSDVRVHVIGAERSGGGIDDLRTSEQNRLTANTIARVIEELANDPNCALHVSLAGGRKTMSYYVGYALSIYGRIQDSLSHVLVNEPFELVPEFHYPPQSPRMMTTRFGQEVSSDLARIDLSDVPFVRIGAALDRRLIPRGLDFSEVVARVDAILPVLTGTQPLVLDVRERMLRVGPIEIKLDNQATGLYWYLRDRGTLDTFRCTTEQATDLLNRMYRAAPTGKDGRIADGVFARACLQPGLQPFVKRLSKLASDINGAIQGTLGIAGRQRFGLLTPRETGIYRLQIPRELVSVTNIPKRSML